jgi:hypothetical protein
VFCRVPHVSRFSRHGRFTGVILSLLLISFVHAPAADIPTQALLDRGFQALYQLDFDRGHQEFANWEKQNPDNPVGAVSQAAGYLFSEFHRLGILEAQFYENDSTFEQRRKQNPDPQIKQQFEAAVDRAEKLSQARLAKDSKDRDALFSMTLASGLRADYAALIEKRNLVSLHYTKEATVWAAQLLAVDSQCYDAYVATGISKYIIGSMAAPIRWVLHIGGVSGDKQQGIGELQLAASKGRYLAPFARILLSIAYVRDHDKTQARALLASLRDEFPSNPLFAQEIARLDSR